ncbi:MAG: NYN domain-containing protein [Methylovulum sp.]
MQNSPKIALFIDADNAPASHINQILSELATYGVVNIRRAYGNWKNQSLYSWEECLHDNAIQPIQQFDLTN